jgi:ubiquinone biosynthesis protein
MNAKAYLRLAAIVFIAGGIAACQLPHLLRAAIRGRVLLLEALGSTLAACVETLGPVFIKMAQMLSYRTDLLPPALLNPLIRLQDRVSPLSSQRIRTAVEVSLGRPPEESFGAFSDRPLASGSVAVVCKATTRCGQPVAVKVVRPGVADRIERDLACIRYIVSLIARSRRVRDLPILATFDTIASIIAAQTDMIRESQNLTAFRSMLPAHRRLAVPKPFPELTTSTTLVMELIEDAVPLMQAPIPSRVFRRAARDLLELVYAMIFVRGFVHCDLHPGNLLCRADGTLVLLDAGLVAVLTDQERTAFRDFFLGLVVNAPDECVGAMLRSALRIPDELDSAGFRRDVASLVRSYHRRTAGTFLIAEFVFRVFELQRKHRLPGAPGFVSAIWALVMFEGLVRQRYPDLDFQLAAQPFLMGEIVDRLKRPGAVGAQHRGATNAS